MLQLGLKVTFELVEGKTTVGQIVNFAGGMQQAVVRTSNNQIWSVPVGQLTVSKELTRAAYLEAFRSMTVMANSIRDWEEKRNAGLPAVGLPACRDRYEQADALTRRIEAWAGSVGFALPDYSEVQRYCNGGFGVSGQ